MKLGSLRGPWPLPVALAWRYMLGQRSRILTSTAAAALAATGLGVTAMVVALALMTGYTQDLERRLGGLQGEIVASPLTREAFAASSEKLSQLPKLPGVARIGRVAYGEGSLSSQEAPDGVSVILRGVEPGNLPLQAPSLPAAALAPDDQGIPGILLGKELQRQLAVREGELLRLVLVSLDPSKDGRGVSFRYRTVRCVGHFAIGFAEFDARWAAIDLGVLEAARQGPGLDVVEITLQEGADPVAALEQIEQTLGDFWLVERWQDANEQLFAVLAMQKWLLFFVLGLIVVVSTFNTASTLVILVRERLADIGVLAALGLSPARLFGLFVSYGLGLGLVGITLGIVVGTTIAWALTTFELVRFDPEVAAVYFIDSVSFRVTFGDLAAVSFFTLAVTLLACAFPAWRAARLLPGAALRAE